MARLKIDYGIDLGTTNSAICRLEKGEPVIIKSDTLKDTMPSCVSFNKKKSCKVGDSAYNDMKSDKRRASKSWKQSASNTYIEFKRTMGGDTRYHSSFMEKDFTSEELSAEVLKTLKKTAAEAVYIGDSDVDVDTAKEAGMDGIFVNWGFRGREFLLEHGAKCVVDTPEELERLLIGKA